MVCLQQQLLKISCGKTKRLCILLPTAGGSTMPSRTALIVFWAARYVDVLSCQRLETAQYADVCSCQ